MNRNNLYYGFFIGAASPIMGFALVYLIFELMVNNGYMDPASTSIESQRIRTIFLIAICTNIYWIRRFNRPFVSQTLRGVVIATMFYSLLWFGNYYSTLYA